MIDLEQALTDLAEHLDCPSGTELTDVVRARLAPKQSRWRGLLAAAAIVLLVAAIAVVSIAPAREAVADWLGIGTVQIRRSDRPPAANAPGARTVPGARDARRDAAVAARLADARAAVTFPVVLPRDPSAGSLHAVDVDHRVPGGLVALTYDHFTVVEVASQADQGPALGKFITGATRVDPVTVSGAPGFWIAGAHEIGYIDRSGAVETDTVRRAGSVLLWERDGVTYRIEGFDRLADAERVAASLR